MEFSEFENAVIANVADNLGVSINELENIKIDKTKYEKSAMRWWNIKMIFNPAFYTFLFIIMGSTVFCSSFPSVITETEEKIDTDINLNLQVFHRFLQEEYNDAFELHKSDPHYINKIIEKASKTIISVIKKYKLK